MNTRLETVLGQLELSKKKKKDITGRTKPRIRFMKQVTGKRPEEKNHKQQRKWREKGVSCHLTNLDFKIKKLYNKISAEITYDLKISTTCHGIYGIYENELIQALWVELFLSQIF